MSDARVFFFFFNDTATTEIYTLSLHDALPISRDGRHAGAAGRHQDGPRPLQGHRPDRKSTRLNSSHLVISYAVFCLKKKKKQNTQYPRIHPPEPLADTFSVGSLCTAA